MLVLIMIMVHHSGTPTNLRPSLPISTSDLFCLMVQCFYRKYMGICVHTDLFLLTTSSIQQIYLFILQNCFENITYHIPYISESLLGVLAAHAQGESQHDTPTFICCRYISRFFCDKLVYDE
jgi:hypothetical protein